MNMLLAKDATYPACPPGPSACRGGRLPCPTPRACQYINARHEQAAEQRTDIGADTDEASMGEGGGAILWPLAVPALAFVVWLAATFWPW